MTALRSAADAVGTVGVVVSVVVAVAAVLADLVLAVGHVAAHFVVLVEAALTDAPHRQPHYPGGRPTALSARARPARRTTWPGWVMSTSRVTGRPRPSGSAGSTAVGRERRTGRRCTPYRLRCSARTALRLCIGPCVWTVSTPYIAAACLGSLLTHFLHRSQARVTRCRKSLLSLFRRLAAGLSLAGSVLCA